MIGFGFYDYFNSERKNIPEKEEYLDAEILVIGSGLIGSTIARLFADMGKRVLVLEKNSYVGGFLYDYVDEFGVITNLYGPQFFHTESEYLWSFFNRFSEFIPYIHRVVGVTTFENSTYKFPLPVNFDSVNVLLNEKGIVVSNKEEFNDAINKFPQLFGKIFNHCKAFRENFDSRYYSDKYQGIPRFGYTRFIKNILNDKSNIVVEMGEDYFNSVYQKSYNFKEIYFTGRIDEYFKYSFGKLDYKSYGFIEEVHDFPIYQSNSVVEYINNDSFSRIIEYKHFYGQGNPEKTRIFKEYEIIDGHPNYLVVNEENRKKLRKYELLAEEETKKKNIHFLGRLSKFNNPNNLGGIVSSVIEFFEKKYPTMENITLEKKSEEFHKELSMTIVISHCKENLNWAIKEINERRKEFKFVRVFIYEKCLFFYRTKHLFENHFKETKGVEIKLISLPNLGKEGHTFLHFILTSTCYFSDINVFYQGRAERKPQGGGNNSKEMWRWNQMVISKINEFNYQEDVQKLNHFYSLYHANYFETWYYWFNLDGFNISKLRYRNGMGFCDYWEKTVGKVKAKEENCDDGKDFFKSKPFSKVRVSYRGEFVATDIALHRILAKHRDLLEEFYSNLLNKSLNTKFKIGHILERLWHTIFKGHVVLDQIYHSRRHLNYYSSPKKGIVRTILKNFQIYVS